VLLKVLDDLRHADIRPTGIELSGDEFPSLFGNARKAAVELLDSGATVPFTALSQGSHRIA
jgi:hypothetical protein